MKKLITFRAKLLLKQIGIVFSAIAITLTSVTPALASTNFTSYSTPSSYIGHSYLTLQNGSFWYLEADSNSPTDRHYIGNMTTSGVVTAHYNIATPSMPSGFEVRSITAGSDGNIWFNGLANTYVYVGKLDTSTGVVAYLPAGPVTTYSNLRELVASPDGYLWYSIKSNSAQSYSHIIRVDTTTGNSAIGSTFDNQVIIRGPAVASDGVVWHADSYHNTVVRNSTSYVVPTTQSQPGNLAAGKDGEMWFIESIGGKIGKVAPTGTISEYSPPSGYASQLTLGSDGSMWFTQNSGTGKLGRITSSGTITEYNLPAGVNSANNILQGPDGNIWFVADNKIWKLVVTSDITSYDLASGYLATGQITAANGTIWYIEKTSTSTDNVIGNMTTSGAILGSHTLNATIGAPVNYTLKSLVTGSDGNVWFHGIAGGHIYIGQLDVTTGTITFFGPGPITTSSSYSNLAAGKDGALWYSIKSNSAQNYAYIIKTDVSTGLSTVESILDSQANVTSVAAGPDNRVWYSDYYFNYVKAGSTIRLMPVKPSSPGALTLGADGNMWLVENSKLAYLTPSASLTEFTLPDIAPSYYLAPGVIGSDAAIWFIGKFTGVTKVGKITTTGVVTEYPLPAGVINPRNIIRGPDEAMWFVTSAKLWKISY